MEKIVIALGGNALQAKNTAPTAGEQLKVVRKTCEKIADISSRGYEVAIVHGNGPQVGRILLASETAKDVTPAMPFDVCGAMSQGYIGYHIQQALKYALSMRNRNVPVLTVATQVVVDENDPGFENPTKPIGPFYSEEEAKALMEERIHHEGGCRKRMAPCRCVTDSKKDCRDRLHKASLGFLYCYILRRRRHSSH